MEHRKEHGKEQRKEQRIALPGLAKLRLLDAIGTKRLDGIWDVRILDVSGSGMRLRLPRPLPCGTLVEVDAGETLSLGEVCRCEPEQSAMPEIPHTTYNVGIQVKHTLASLGELERFSRLLDEYSGSRRESAVTAESVQE